MAYKTLILIDNTNEMTTLNQQIIKETLKQFIKHVDKDDKVAVAVSGEKAEYLTDYEDSLNTQLKTIDELQFYDKNAPLADVLMEVLINWKDSDVAFRDILCVSCRGIATGGDYSEEELLFEVNNKQYPIYTLACEQDDNNAFVKSMNSLSRISGGVSVGTNVDAVSDAEVDKQLADKLLSAMKEYRRLEAIENEEKLEGDIEDESEEYIDGKEEETDEELYDSEYDEISIYDEELPNLTAENVIYEDLEMTRDNSSVSGLIYPAIIVTVFVVIMAFVLSIKRDKSRREEEKLLNTRTSKKIKSNSNNTGYFGTSDETETVTLNSYFDDDGDSGTRLLFQTKEGLEITLEDRSNPTKYFRACVRDSIVIGRNDKLCDLPITYDDSVSARHCELYQRDGELYCRDLSSSNGTMINQQKVYQEIKVESGDILRIGRLSFFVQILGDSYE